MYIRATASAKCTTPSAAFGAALVALAVLINASLPASAAEVASPSDATRPSGTHRLLVPAVNEVVAVVHRPAAPAAEPTPPQSPAAVPTAPAPASAAAPSPTAMSTPKPTATPLGPPTFNATCATSLQALVDAAAPGTTVTAPGCVHRETLTIGKPLTLVGRPGAEIRGSDVWVGWAASGGRWVSSLTVPAFPIRAGVQCAPDTRRCLWPEQVFVDGRALRQVAADPHSGEFAVDAGRRIVLADDPSGRVVEVTTRRNWVNVYADNVTIQGVTMRHAANDAQYGAIANASRNGFTLRDSTLSDTHGPVVTISSGSNNKLLHNDISRGGQEGVQGWRASDTLVQGNVVHDNNTEEYDSYWEAGGLKFAEHRNLVLDGNHVYNNGGPGLWCDIGCTNVTYSNNRVHDNASIGIFFEISNGAKIFGNAVWSNGGWAGIYISSSANAEAYGNTVAWNAGSAIFVSSDARGDATNNQVGTVGNVVRDNLLLMERADMSALKWWQDPSGPAILFAPTSNNRATGNAYWSVGGRVTLEWAGAASYLAPGAAAPADPGALFLSAEEARQRAASVGIPVGALSAS